MPRYAIPFCAPCMLDSAYDMLCKATGVTGQVLPRDSELFAKHVAAVREFLQILQGFDDKSYPVILAGDMIKVVKRISGNPDPYAAEKAESNRLCLKFYPKLASDLKNLPDVMERLRKAMVWAIAGNTIDFITRGHAVTLTEKSIQEVLAQAEGLGLARDDFPVLWSLLRAGNRKVIYLLDNAGEVVFDKLAICVLSKDLHFDVTAVVKGGPVANDVLAEDAAAVTLTECSTHVSSTGTDDLGFHWDRASPQFQALFEGNPVVIAKGHANLEAFNAFGERMPRCDFFSAVKLKCDANAVFAGAIKGQQAIMHLRQE